MTLMLAVLMLVVSTGPFAQVPPPPSSPCAGNCGDAARLEKAAVWVARVPELARSPAADDIAKGFAAVIARDWTAALASWREALDRDPENETLGRGVDLVAWMVEYRARGGQHATVSGARTDWARIGDIDFSQHLDGMLDHAVLADAIRFAEEQFER